VRIFKKNNSRENIPLTWRRLDDTSASVICPNGHKIDECNFHEYIILEEWKKYTS